MATYCRRIFCRWNSNAATCNHTPYLFKMLACFQQFYAHASYRSSKRRGHHPRIGLSCITLQHDSGEVFQKDTIYICSCDGGRKWASDVIMQSWGATDFNSNVALAVFVVLSLILCASSSCITDDRNHEETSTGRWWKKEHTMILAHSIWWTGDFSVMIRPPLLNPLCCFLKAFSSTEYDVRTCWYIADQSVLLDFINRTDDAHDVEFL